MGGCSVTVREARYSYIPPSRSLQLQREEEGGDGFIYLFRDAIDKLDIIIVLSHLLGREGSYLCTLTCTSIGVYYI